MRTSRFSPASVIFFLCILVGLGSSCNKKDDSSIAPASTYYTKIKGVKVNKILSTKSSNVILRTFQKSFTKPVNSVNLENLLPNPDFYDTMKLTLLGNHSTKFRDSLDVPAIHLDEMFPFNSQKALRIKGHEAKVSIPVQKSNFNLSFSINKRISGYTLQVGYVEKNFSAIVTFYIVDNKERIDTIQGTIIGVNRETPYFSTKLKNAQ